MWRLNTLPLRASTAAASSASKDETTLTSKTTSMTRDDIGSVDIDSDSVLVECAEVTAFVASVVDESLPLLLSRFVAFALACAVDVVALDGASHGARPNYCYYFERKKNGN